MIDGKDFKEVVEATAQREKLKKILAEAKQVGYKIVWVGEENSHWQGTSGRHDCVIAEPKTYVGSWPAIWEIVRKQFSTSCGNGLKESDNIFTQRDFNTELCRKYDLTKDEHLEL